MIRFSTIIGLLALLLLPQNVAAFWFASEGQCFEQDAAPMLGVDYSVADEAEPGCVDVADPSDPSSNVCFEAAGNPISTLPQLIAESQAERVVAAVLEKTAEVAVVPPLIPSPNEASVEDPLAPGLPLMARPNIPRPRPAPNACSVYPEDCQTAPWVPTLNLDVSVPHANAASNNIEVQQLPELESRRGPPAEGVGPSIGIFSRLDRPPQVG